MTKRMQQAILFPLILLLLVSFATGCAEQTANAPNKTDMFSELVTPKEPSLEKKWNEVIVSQTAKIAGFSFYTETYDSIVTAVPIDEHTKPDELKINKIVNLLNTFNLTFSDCSDQPDLFEKAYKVGSLSIIFRTESWYKLSINITEDDFIFAKSSDGRIFYAQAENIFEQMSKLKE